MSRARKTREVLEKLTGLYKYGALQAETDPAEFLGMVCEELEALRGVQEAGAVFRAAAEFNETNEDIEEQGDAFDRLVAALEAHAAFTEKWGR